MVARRFFDRRAHGRGSIGGERCAHVSGGTMATGLWKQYRAEDLATPGAFARDPKLVWEWYDWRRSLIAQAKPNPGHYALAAAETRARKFTLITQNVDGLHELAGSRNVLRLHGSIWMLRCVECGREREDRRTPLPEIPPRCECGGMLRPGVVWFGEALPAKIWQEAEKAARSGRSVSADRNFGGGLSGRGLGDDREIVGRARGRNQYRGNRALRWDRRISARAIGRALTPIDRMKICYLDAFSGISGDMTVGALIDAGADGTDAGAIARSARHGRQVRSGERPSGAESRLQSFASFWRRWQEPPPSEAHSGNHREIGHLGSSQTKCLRRVSAPGRGRSQGARHLHRKGAFPRSRRGGFHLRHRRRLHRLGSCSTSARCTVRR